MAPLIVSEVKMEDGVCAARRWEDLQTDILVKIFHSFSIFELTSGIAHVCSGWRSAACDPCLWNTLDLSMLESNFIKIPCAPFVYVSSESDKILTRILKIALNLSKGNTKTLIFHYNLYVNEYQLTYTAERCPRLRRLVLPSWDKVKSCGIRKAISIWRDLESLTMQSTSKSNLPYLMEEIANNCKNFHELKMMDTFNHFFANSLIEHLPNLRILSLRCSMLMKHALILILDGLRGMQVLNISHCLIVEAPSHRVPKVIEPLDQSILDKTARLREFITCARDSCNMCQRMRNDEGLMRWYKYEKWLWKVDEVRSLAL